MSRLSPSRNQAPNGRSLGGGVGVGAPPRYISADFDTKQFGKNGRLLSYGEWLSTFEQEHPGYVYLNDKYEPPSNRYRSTTFIYRGLGTHQREDRCACECR